MHRFHHSDDGNLEVCRKSIASSPSSPLGPGNKAGKFTHARLILIRYLFLVINISECFANVTIFIYPVVITLGVQDNQTIMVNNTSLLRMGSEGL